jgi:hypothetical protein
MKLVLMLSVESSPVFGLDLKLHCLRSGLPDRVRTSTKLPHCYPKMMIIIPRSCKCPADVHSLDPNFVHVGHIPYTHTRSGNVERDYKSSVYDFTYSRKDGKEVWFYSTN